MRLGDIARYQLPVLIYRALESLFGWFRAHNFIALEFIEVKQRVVAAFMENKIPDRPE